MGENNLKKITVRLFMAILAGISAVLMFVPAYAIKMSEGGYSASVEMSGWNAFQGKMKAKAFGQSMTVSFNELGDFVDADVPNMARTEMILCLLIPVAVIVLLYVVKQYEDDLLAKIIAGISAVNVVIWFLFNSKITSLLTEGGSQAELREYGVKMGATFWFWLIIIVNILIIATAVMVAMKKMTLNMEVKEAIECVKNSVPSNGTNKVSAPKTEAIAFCAGCGGPLTGDSQFCANCGNPVPAEVLAEAARRAEAAARAAEEEAARAAAANTVAFCQNCGAKLSGDSAFCANCGSKVN